MDTFQSTLSLPDGMSELCVHRVVVGTCRTCRPDTYKSLTTRECAAKGCSRRLRSDWPKRLQRTCTDCPGLPELTQEEYDTQINISAASQSTTDHADGPPNHPTTGPEVWYHSTADPGEVAARHPPPQHNQPFSNPNVWTYGNGRFNRTPFIPQETRRRRPPRSTTTLPANTPIARPQSINPAPADSPVNTWYYGNDGASGTENVPANGEVAEPSFDQENVWGHDNPVDPWAEFRQ